MPVEDGVDRADGRALDLWAPAPKTVTLRSGRTSYEKSRRSRRRDDRGRCVLVQIVPGVRAHDKNPAEIRAIECEGGGVENLHHDVAPRHSRGVTMRSMTAECSRRVTIKLHADQRACSSIDRAARICRISAAEFILEAACREAEALVLDSRSFVSDDRSFSRFADLDVSKLAH